METENSNYSEKKTSKVSVRLLFVMILLNFDRLSGYSLGQRQSDYSSASYLKMLQTPTNILSTSNRHVGFQY